MVAIVTGAGLGLERTSAWALGKQGQVGQADQGRGGDQVYVNGANGNLIIQNTDEVLVGVGPDDIVTRTYNSLSNYTSNGWQESFQRRITGLTGTVNTTGSTIKHIAWDGSDVTYTWNASLSAYVANEGADADPVVGRAPNDATPTEWSAAYDTITFNSGANTWTWTDGSTQLKETYDNANLGRITSAYSTDSKALTYAYNGSGQLVSVTTSDGESTTMTYSGGNLTQVVTNYIDQTTAPPSAKTLTRVRYGYDAQNRLTTVTVDLSPEDNAITDGKTYVTTYAYGLTNDVNDPNFKKVTSITQSDGSSLVIGYNTWDGTVASLTQTVASGVTRTTTFGYDYDTGQFTNVTDSLGQPTQLYYLTSGRLGGITTPSGDYTAFGYDSMGDVTSVTTFQNETTNFTYDSHGNRVSAIDAQGDTVRRTYGSKNEVLTETKYLTPQSGGSGEATPVTTRYAYDANDHLRYSVSPDGHVTEYVNDTTAQPTSYGQPTRVIAYAGNIYPLAGLNPTDTITEATLNTWRNGADKTAAQRTDYAYDYRGGLASTTSYALLNSDGTPNLSYASSTTSYVYDQAGQLLQKILAGAAAAEVYHYDGLGRVTSKVDALGATTTITFTDATTTTAVTLVNGLVQTSVYDKAGELLTYTEAGSDIATATTTYNYDALGRLRMVTDPTGLKTYTMYNPDGLKTADILADGTITEYVYNNDGLQVSTIKYRYKLNSTQLASLVDAGGNPTNVTLASLRPTADSGDRYSWQVYDAAQRLVETIDAVGAVTTYAYDGASRLVSTTAYYNQLSGTTLTGIKGSAPTSPVLPTAWVGRDRVIRNFYDGEGHLAGVLDAAGYLTEIRYDGAGRKVQTIQYFNITGSTYWTTGTLAQLVTSAGTNAKDIHNWFVYDARGFLRDVIDGEGDITTYGYTPLGDVSVETRGRWIDPQTLLSGSVPTFVALSLMAIKGSALDSITYTRNNYGQVLSETRTLAGGGGEQTTYAYDNMRRLFAKTTYALNGDVRTTIWKYDSRGNLVVELPGVGVAALVALGSGGTADQVNAIYAAYQTTYAYDADDRMVSKTEPGGAGLTNRTLYYYDSDGRLIYQIDAMGEVTEYRYNAWSQRSDIIVYGTRITSGLSSMTGGVVTTAVTSTVSALASSSFDSHQKFAYYATGNLSDVYDGTGLRTTVYGYNAFGDIGNRQDLIPGGVWVQTAYDVDLRGHVARETKNNAGTGQKPATNYQYDAFGRVTLTTYPNGNTQATSYDRAGRVVTSTDGLGFSTSYSYDGRGNVLTTTDPLGNVTTYAYDEFERRITTTLPGSITSSVQTNAYGQVITITDALGQQTTYTYDADGNLKTTTNPLGQVVQNAYDNADRLTDVTDASGVVTHYDYDAANRVHSRTVNPGGMNLVTTYGYDPRGDRTTITDPTGMVTTIGYDLDGRTTTYTVDSGGLALATTYTYDPSGHVLTMTEAAGTPAQKVTSYTYDAMERLVAKAVDPTGANLITAYAYDLNDNVVSTTDPTGAITRYVYDGENQEIFCIDAAGGVKTYKYDANGAKTKEIDCATLYATSGTPTLAAMLDWYNGGNGQTSHADTANDRISRWVYEPNGRLSFSIDPTGAVTSYKYDGNGRLVKLLSAATLGSFSDAVSYQSMLDWYNGGNGQTAHSSAADTISRSVYDTAGRLAFSIDGAGAVISYKYDANGRVVKQLNAVTLGSFGDSVSYQYMLDWYNGGNGQTAHSNAADTISRLVYDAAGRVAFSIDATGAVISDKYDGDGRVVKQLRAITLGSFGDNVSYQYVLDWYNGGVIDRAADGV